MPRSSADGALFPEGVGAPGGVTAPAYSEEELGWRLCKLELEVQRAVLDGETEAHVLTSLAKGLQVLMGGGGVPAVALVSDGWHRPVADAGLPAAFRAALQPQALTGAEGPCAVAAATGRRVVCTGDAGKPAWGGLWDAARAHGIGACWSSPATCPEGKVIATVDVFCPQDRPPTDQETTILAAALPLVGQVVRRAGAAERLRQSERHYRAVYDLAPVLIWEEDWVAVKAMLVDLKAAGVTDLAAYLDNDPGFVARAIAQVKVTNINRAAADVFKAASVTALMEAPEQVSSTQASHDTFRKAIIAYFEGRRTFEADCSTVDLNGERLELLVRMALPDFASPDTWVVLIELDATDLKIANERFAAVAATTSDVIWDMDMVAQSVWCSNGITAAFGHDPRDIRSGLVNWSDLLHPDDRARVLEDQNTLLAGDETEWDREYRFRRADGSYALVHDRGTLVRGAGNRPLRMIGSTVDITQRRQTEEKLQQSLRLDALGRLTGGVAHDFNNLLTVILGNLDRMLDQPGLATEARRSAEAAVAATERAAELTSQLLVFGRQQPLRTERADLNDAIRRTELLLRRSLREDIRIGLDLTPEPLMIEADIGKFDVALLNVVLNARDAMPGGGDLTIGAHRQRIAWRDRVTGPPPGTYAVVTVSDTGTGMPADVVERAFEPFFTTKEAGRGSGMGLSLVYGYMVQSGGHATIRSSPGAGTMVQLFFPLIEEVQMQKPDPVIAAKVQGGSGHVLLVEDDDLVRGHVAAQLQALGYRVTEATNGPAAIDLLVGSERFDLLFTDMVMPGGMNGRELAERALEIRPGIKVLFTSGYSSDAVLRKGILSRDVQFLSKPYRRVELAAKVREVMDGGG